MSVNFPNNPTGAVPDRASWAQLARLCDERGIHLFSDEVYRGLEQGPDGSLPHAADLSPRALSLNVMSKAYGLPGSADRLDRLPGPGGARPPGAGQALHVHLQLGAE